MEVFSNLAPVKNLKHGEQTDHFMTILFIFFAHLIDVVKISCW